MLTINQSSVYHCHVDSMSIACTQLQAAEEKYNKSKMVHSIMRHVAETTGQDLEQLYTQIGWPLYKMYGHAFEAFKQMVQDPEPIFARLQVCTSILAPVQHAAVHFACVCNVLRQNCLLSSNCAKANALTVYRATYAHKQTAWLSL